MRVSRTIPLILTNPTPELRQIILNFGEAKRAISEVAFNEGRPLHALELHRRVYRSIRPLLRSQMACSAIRSVAGAYQSAKSNKNPAKKAFGFGKSHAVFLVGCGKDASFKKDGTLSISTTIGRQRLAYKIPENFLENFKNAISHDSLNIKLESDSSLKCFLTITLEVPDQTPGKPIGVDLNATNSVVAVNTEGEKLFVTGRKYKIKNKKNRKTVSRLQRKKSAQKAEGKSNRSVRRVLKRLSRKRSRRTLDFCRVIAKRLLDWAGPNTTIVLESLKFDKRRKTSKAVNRKLSEWPYGLTRDCIKNKAELIGVAVVEVNPAYTSQHCSKCGNLGVRNKHKFDCKVCGFSEHADINAATNIRNKFAG